MEQYKILKYYLTKLQERIPKYDTPIESKYLYQQLYDIIYDEFDLDEDTAKILTDIIREEIDKLDIELIGFTREKICCKQLTLFQVDEILFDYFIKKHNDKFIVCQVVNANKLKPLLLYPSNINASQLNILFETYATMFGEINERVIVSLCYDYKHNEYFFVKPMVKQDDKDKCLSML